VKKKGIPTWGAATLGLDAGDLPAAGVTRQDVRPPPERSPGRLLTGDPDDAARELVRLLRDEAKVL
jgi:electron transfer flavoprotein beta subunit